MESLVKFLSKVMKKTHLMEKVKLSNECFLIINYFLERIFLPIIITRISCIFKIQSVIYMK